MSAARLDTPMGCLPFIVRNSRAAAAAANFINNTSAAGNKDFNIIISTGAVLISAFQILISSWERFKSLLQYITG